MLISFCSKITYCQYLQASAKRHGINVKHGTSNPGLGDCAFEAIVQNINDRRCFNQKFHQSIDYYRRIWALDMGNRTVDTPLNTLTPKQWLEGWKQMLVPGAYERDIYGDLMLPGIACGVHKKLLIFNTNPETPHDPIYIIDPSEFNVDPDSQIPILLAYNMSHYESLEPLEEADIAASIDLVKEYQAGKYRYGRKDINTLISLEYRGFDEENNLTRSNQMKLDSKTYVPDRSKEKHNVEIIFKKRAEEKDKINQETQDSSDEVSQMSNTDIIKKPQERADSKMHSNETYIS